jgi:tetratricopeptide (TPR) repeat protein
MSGVGSSSQSKFQDSIEAYSNAIHFDSNSSNNKVTYYCRAIAQAGLSRYKEAIEDYNIAMSENYLPAYQNSILINKILGRNPDVEKIYKHTKQLIPSNARDYCAKGYIANATRQIDEAKSYYEQALRLLDKEQKNALNYRIAARAKWALGQYQAAEGDLNEATKLAPKDASLFYLLGRIYFDHGKFQAALVEFEKSIDLNPHDAETYYRKGKTCEALNESANAKLAYHKALEKAPDHAKAKAALGIVNGIVPASSSTGVNEQLSQAANNSQQAGSQVLNTTDNNNIASNITGDELVESDPAIPSNVIMNSINKLKFYEIVGANGSEFQDIQPTLSPNSTKAFDSMLSKGEKQQEALKTMLRESIQQQAISFDNTLMQEIDNLSLANASNNNEDSQTNRIGPEICGAIKKHLKKGNDLLSPPNISKIENELEQLNKSLENTQEIAALIATLKQQASINLDVKQRLDTLESEHNKLSNYINNRSYVLLYQKRILELENKELSYFYIRLRSKLTEIFLACKVMSSGYVEANSIGNPYAYIASQLVNFPVVSLANIIFAVTLPPASMVLKLITSVIGGGADLVNGFSARRNAVRNSRIGYLITSLQEMEDTIDKIACSLTLRYTEQIMELDLTPQASNGIGKFKNTVINWLKCLDLVDGRKLNATELLADYAAGYILYQLYQIKEVDDPNKIDLVQLSLKAVARSPSVFHPQKIIPKEYKNKNEKWTDEGLFQQAGIRTPDEKEYVAKSGSKGNKLKYCSKANIYGFRTGDEDEVKELQLTENISLPYTLGISHDKFIAETKSDIQELKEKVECLQTVGKINGYNQPSGELSQIIKEEVAKQVKAYLTPSQSSTKQIIASNISIFQRNKNVSTNPATSQIIANNNNSSTNVNNAEINSASEELFQKQRRHSCPSFNKP